MLRPIYTKSKASTNKLASIILVTIISLSIIFVQIQPASAATVFYDGFESGDGSAWTATNGGVEYSSSVKYNGSYSFVANANTEYCSKTIDSLGELYVSAFIRIDTLPADGQENLMIRIMNTSSNIVGQLGVKRVSGTAFWQLGYLNGGSLVYDISSTVQLYAATWFNVTLHIKCSASAGEYHVYINNALVNDLTHTGVNTVYAQANIVRFGLPYTNFATTVYVDDVYVADSGGIDPAPEPEPEEPPVEYSTGALFGTGVGTDYCLHYDSGSVERWITEGVMTRLEAYLDDGFNSSRVSFRFSDTMTGWYSGSSKLDYAKMDRLLEIFDASNMSLIPTSWDDQSAKSAFLSTFKDDWVDFATEFAGDSRIAAFSIGNEPNTAMLADWAGVTVSQLNANPTLKNQMRLNYYTLIADIIDAIHVVDPTRICIVPYPYQMGGSFYSWYNNELVPTGLTSKSNVMFDILHPYFMENEYDWVVAGSATTPTQKAGWYGANYIAPAVAALNSSRCWAGETFAWLGEMTIATPNVPSHTPDYDLQKEWLISMMDAYAEYGVGFCIWASMGGQRWTAFVDAQDETVYPVETELTQYSLTVTSTVGGSVNPSVGVHLYYEGALVNVTLTPTGGYIAVLAINGVNVTLTNNAYLFTITQNTTAAALFYYPEGIYYLLNLTSSNVGLTSPDVGEQLYLADANVTLSAYPVTPYLFVNWVINGSTIVTDLEYSFIIGGNTTAYANFTINTIIDTVNYDYVLNPVDDGYQLLSSTTIAYSGANASYAINFALEQGAALYLYDGTYSDNGAAITLNFSAGASITGESRLTRIVLATWTIPATGDVTVTNVTFAGSA